MFLDFSFVELPCAIHVDCANECVSEVTLNRYKRLLRNTYATGQPKGRIRASLRYANLCRSYKLKMIENRSFRVYVYVADQVPLECLCEPWHWMLFRLLMNIIRCCEGEFKKTFGKLPKWSGILYPFISFICRTRGTSNYSLKYWRDVGGEIRQVALSGFNLGRIV